MTIFQRERLRDFFPEAMDLIKLHYSEIAWNQDKIPLDIDEAAYREMDEKDMLICFTGRDGGNLVAYAAYFFRGNPHYKSTKFAVNDVIYVHPLHRGSTGARFIDYVEKEMRDLGAQVITYHVKEYFNWGSLLKRKGFERLESLWAKWIGD